MEDLILLDIKDALDMVDNDKSLYKMLLDGFLSDSPFDKEYLFDLIKKSDFANAATYVHRIKGAASQLGATALSNCGKLLENVLREKEVGNKEELAKEFATLYEKTYTLMQNAAKKFS